MRRSSHYPAAVLRRLEWPRTALSHVVAVVALTGLGIVAFGFAVHTPPFDIDNLVGLSLGDVHTPATIWGPESTTTIPAFRPFSRTTIWLQYQLFGVASAQYFAVNVAIWIAVGILAYALVYIEFGSVIGGLAAGALVVSDWRAKEALFWIGERQASLAVFLGLAALLWAYVLVKRAENSPTHRSRWFEVGGVTVLLLASALSKEYGLAFAGAVSTLGLLQISRSIGRPLLASGLVALGLYVLLREALAGGATAGEYCDESIGYWGMHLPNVCGDGRTALLAMYLVFASLVGTFFPSLFDDDGALLVATTNQFYQPGVVSLMASGLLAGLAIFAWVTMPRRTLPFLSLVVGNAVLGFLIYRTRNQLVGAVGIYVSAAAGASTLLGRVVRSSWAQRTRVRRGVVIAGAVAILVPAAAAIGIRAHNLHDRIADHQAVVKGMDPCAYYASALSPGGLGPELSAPVISEAARRWNRAPTGCAPPPARAGTTKHIRSSKDQTRQK